MPNSDKAQVSSKPPNIQILTHEPETLRLLEPEAKTCQFHAQALDLARYGLCLHPLKPGDKVPLFKGWQASATSDPDQIDQWAKDYPTANVGVVPGEPSGVFIVDADLRHGAHASLDKYKRLYGELPLTWTALTPNGWHFYFQHPGGRIRNYTLDHGLEIKGDKGNVVAPGSIHPGGLSYRWQPYCSPGELPLAKAPQWLLDVLERKHKWMPAGDMRPVGCQVNILGAPKGLGEGTGTAELLRGADVLSYFSDESVVKQILPLLGLGEVEIGEKFHCVLHPEKRESASILRPETPGNPFMYMDFHERERDRRAFPLPQVYYHLMRGKPEEPIRELPKPTFLVWALRLLRDAGVISGVKVQAPRLPETVKTSVRRVYEGFWDLLSLKYLVEKTASPYTWRFAEAWVGLSRKAVSGAMRWLLGAGYLRSVGYFGSDGAGNKMMLYRLGTRHLVQRLSGRGLLERGGQTEIIESVDAAVVEAEAAEQQAEASKAGVKPCEKCGEVRTWYTFDELLLCGQCFQPLDTG